MLIANPLFQIAPEFFLAGEAAKYRFANDKARDHDKRGRDQTGTLPVKAIGPRSIAVREMANLAD
jgi:hypothetical protein